MRRAGSATLLALAAFAVDAPDAFAVGYTDVVSGLDTITITNTQASYGITVDVSIDLKSASTPDDDLFVLKADIDMVGGGCTKVNDGMATCPLTFGVVKHPKIVGTFSGNQSDYRLKVDLDRPGEPMTGTFITPTGNGYGEVDGSATTRGRLNMTGVRLTGGQDDDSLSGGGGIDTLVGNGGDDAFSGGGGSDTMTGGPGDDSFLPGVGALDTVDGGEGTQDSISYGGETAPVKVTLNDVDDGDGVPSANRVTHIRGIENASGGDGADQIVGNAGFNHLYGLAGNDQIDGAGGAHDVLRGGAGDDAITARDTPALFGDLACGSGSDSVIVDALDVVATDCEAVDRSAPDLVPGGGGGSGGDGTGGGSGGTGGGSGNGAAGDTTSPGLTLIKPPASVKRSALLKGLGLGFTTDEPARIEARLVGTAKRVTLARVGEVIVAEATARQGSGARKLRLKPSKKLLGRAKKLTLVVTAIDAAGNERELRRTLKVK